MIIEFAILKTVTMLYILVIILGFLIVTTAVFLTWIYSVQQLWARKRVYTPKYEFFFGHTRQLVTQKECFTEFARRTYNTIRNNNNCHGGIYLVFSPMYFPIDLDIVKNLLQNDFNHFVDRGIYYNEEGDPISAHLFALEGTKWRRLRTKMTPTFTSTKMKMMFDTIVDCADQLQVAVEENFNGGPINIRDVLTRFTVDIICSCAFGIECNSLIDSDNKIIQMARTCYHDHTFIDNFRTFFTFVAPDLSNKLNIPGIKPAMAKFFLELISETVEYREKNNIFRRDFMHLLLQLKNRGELHDDENVHSTDNDEKNNFCITFEELAAQALVFFLAGYETSSTTMTFALFEITTNPGVHEKLRTEILQVLKKYDNKLTYEAITEMHYLDQIIKETLRKHPPLPTLNRICTKDYKVPGTDLIMEKGTKVMIPVVGIHYDERYYPDPEKFDPERFSPENVSSRHQYAFLPFGDGPRMCIGLRFGMLQTKVGLITLIKNYKFSLSEKTPLPLVLDNTIYIKTVKGGMWFNFSKI